MAITELAKKVLEAQEQNRLLFRNPPQGLNDLIDTESERLKEAAILLGREWNGAFSRGHVLLIAACYAGWAVGEEEAGDED